MEASRMELSDGPELIDVDARKAVSYIAVSVFAVVAVSSAFLWIPLLGIVSALATLAAGLMYVVKTGWSWNERKDSALPPMTNLRSIHRPGPSPAQEITEHEEEVQYRYGT